MKIGVVLHPYGEDKPAGLARGIFEFTAGMLRNDIENEYTIFLKKQPRILPQLPGENWRIEILGDSYFWLNRIRTKQKQDVYLFNTPILPFFWKPANAFVLCWDYGYRVLPVNTLRERMRNAFVFLYQRSSLRRADGIIAVSEATKQETMRLFGIAEDKICVVHCGYKHVCDAAEIPVAIPKTFFLFVGIIKERKNVFNMVRAFNLFQRNHPNFHFIIGGNATGEYADVIRAYIHKEGLGDKVIFIGHLNDGQLSYIYRRAQALMFPTLVEGFGFPVLEAIDCGIPVITSNQSSMPEVGGDAVLLVDPYSQKVIAHAMTRIADEPGLRDSLIRKGIEQKGKFSWDKAGREILEAIM